MAVPAAVVTAQPEVVVLAFLSGCLKGNIVEYFYQEYGEGEGLFSDIVSAALDFKETFGRKKR